MSNGMVRIIIIKHPSLFELLEIAPCIFVRHSNPTMVQTLSSLRRKFDLKINNTNRIYLAGCTCNQHWYQSIFAAGLWFSVLLRSVYIDTRRPLSCSIARSSPWIFLLVWSLCTKLFEHRIDDKGFRMLKGVRTVHSNAIRWNQLFKLMLNDRHR